MNSGCSAPTATGSAQASASVTASSYQRSRPAVKGTSPPVRRTTTTWRMLGWPATAASAFFLSGTTRPPRWDSSAVISTFAPESSMRLASDSDEKPENTTVCTAPMRTVAIMATITSGMTGR